MNTNETIEEKISQGFRDFRASMEQKTRSGERYVREQPVKGILWSIAAGYMLRIFPLGFFLRLLAGVLSLAIRPLLFFYVAAKGIELIKRSTSEKPRI